MNDKMREDFETAYIADVSAKHGVESAMNPEWLDKNSNGEYRSYRAAGAWWGWHASRESLVVELPPKIGPCNTAANGYVRPEAEHYDEAIDDCRQAIESLGLKVKQ